MLEDRRTELQGLVVQLYQLRKQYVRAKNEDTKTSIAKIGHEVKAAIESYREDQLTLGEMQRMGERDEAEGEVALLIAWLQDNLNVQTAMHEVQIMSAAAFVVSRFGALRLADVGLCFRWAIEGKYGKLYAKMDTHDLSNWLSQYEAEIGQLRMHKQEENHTRYKGSVWDKRYSTSLRAIFYNQETLNR